MALHAQTGGMRPQLTDNEIETAELAPGQSELTLSDQDNLVLRLRRGQKRVTKTWWYRYADDGRERKLRLGSYPEMSLIEARYAALAAAKQRRGGDDPLAVRLVEEARAQAEAVAVRLSGAPVTLADLVEQWLVNYAQHQHKDQGQRVRAQFVNHVLPHLGPLHVAHLRPAHVTGLLNRIRQKGKARTCGAVLSTLRQLMQWGVMHEYVQRDITTGIKVKGGKGNVRERHLTDQEIHLLYHQLTYATLSPRWRYAIWLILACGTRVEETLLAERVHVDLAQRTWTLPGENRKWVHGAQNNQTLTIHLSDFALEQMRALLLIGGDRYLFAQERVPGEPEQPVNNKTLTHLIHDRQTDTPQEGRTQYNAELRLPGGPWSTHDLRRTCATQMGELGFRPDVIDKCLAHSIGDRITRTYQHQTLRDEMRAAWDAWGARLAELVRAAAADTSTAKAVLADLEARQAAKLATLRAEARARAKARVKAAQASTAGTPAKKTKVKTKTKAVADQAAVSGRLTKQTEAQA